MRPEYDPGASLPAVEERLTSLLVEFDRLHTARPIVSNVLRRVEMGRRIDDILLRRSVPGWSAMGLELLTHTIRFEWPIPVGDIATCVANQTSHSYPLAEAESPFKSLQDSWLSHVTGPASFGA